jgi:hypothetical protein
MFSESPRRAEPDKAADGLESIGSDRAVEKAPGKA